MLQGEHSAILSTFIKLPFVIKIFVLSFFEWPLKSGFTVLKPFESEISAAVSNASDELLNDTPTSLPSPRGEVAMSLVCHFSVVTP